jgi:hypothetical protein
VPRPQSKPSNRSVGGSVGADHPALKRQVKDGSEQKKMELQIWGLEELDPDSRKLKQFDFSPGMTGVMWAYPVFTSEDAAIRFIHEVTADWDAPDKELFLEFAENSIRQLDEQALPRAVMVAVDPSIVGVASESVLSVMMRWGTFVDEQLAKMN